MSKLIDFFAQERYITDRTGITSQVRIKLGTKHGVRKWLYPGNRHQQGRKWAVFAPFSLRCKQPICLRETEYQVLNAESLLNLLALPCLTPWAKGRENGGSPDCSCGNHKKIWLLHISKCPEDKAGSFKVLDLHYFITYSQVYLGSIVIIAL